MLIDNNLHYLFNAKYMCREYYKICEYATEYGYCRLSACAKHPQVITALTYDALPIDTVEVRHGHWEQDGHHIRCSECGIYFCDTDREGDSFPKEYCPNCGARMDEKEQENE